MEQLLVNPSKTDINCPTCTPPDKEILLSVMISSTKQIVTDAVIDGKDNVDKNVCTNVSTNDPTHGLDNNNHDNFITNNNAGRVDLGHHNNSINTTTTSDISNGKSVNSDYNPVNMNVATINGESSNTSSIV